MADQESLGDDGDPDAGERDSVMRVNLAEGCWAVNAAPWRAEREARDMRERRDVDRWKFSRLARPASLACLAWLSHWVVLIGCFSV